MNLLSLAFISSTAFLFFFLPLKRDTYIHIGIIGLVGAGLMRCLATQMSIMLLLATALESVGIASIISASLKRTLKRKRVPYERGVVLFMWAALLLIFTLAMHNLYRFSDINNSNARDLISVVNPWGFVQFIIILACFLNLRDERQVLSLALVRVISFLSIAFIGVYFSVYLGLIQGNTEKALEGTGGIGLANYSTNETAALAVSLLIWHVHFFFSGIRPRLFHAILGVALLALVAISKSRTGLLCAGLVIFIFIIKSKGVGGALIVRPILLAVALVGASFALQIIQERNNSEIEIDQKYDNLQISSEISGSGRSLIWFEYISEYLNAASRNGFSAVFGVGQFGLLDLYGSTILGPLGFAAGTQAFLPIHSDFLGLLFSGGALAVIFFFAGLNWAVAQHKRLGKHPIRISALVVLVLTFAVDMIQYQAGIYVLLLVAIFCNFDTASPRNYSNFQRPGVS